MNLALLNTVGKLIFVLLVFAAGWLSNGWRLQGRVDALVIAQAEARARDATLVADELAAAHRRGDALIARVAAAEAARTLATQEKTDAIRRLTVGRPCLDRAAVRVLNGPGLAPAMPAAAGQLDPAAAAFATDTDVGLWAAEARRAYDTCRGRIAAIAEFFTQETHD